MSQVSVTDAIMVPNMLGGKGAVGLGPVFLAVSAPDDVIGVLVRKDGEVYRDLSTAATEAGYSVQKVFEQSGGDAPLRLALLSLFNGEAAPGTVLEGKWEVPPGRSGEMQRAAAKFVSDAFLGDAGKWAQTEGATGMIVLFLAFDASDAKHKAFLDHALARIRRQFQGYTLDTTCKAEGPLSGPWKYRAMRFLRIPE